MPSFDDIRPYRDDEVNEIIQQLIRKDDFLSLIGRFRAEWLHRLAPWLVRLWIKGYLKRTFGQVRSVDELQERLEPYVRRVLASTTQSVSWSGLEHLDPSQSYLFMSNHRDIVLDPALVNYALYREGLHTCRIAIGDNLVQNPMVADLMRLNKSFLVRRNLSNPREMRNAFLTLSSYIRESIAEGHSVWMAQREGRAKDGIDKTDPAIIKMLHMSHKRDKVPLGDAVRELRIVPVTLSYEFDPCDAEKAGELEERERTGEYVKRENEDIESIVKGITGLKGRIHIAFGAPLADGFESAGEVASALDQRILEQTRFYPVSYAATEKLVSRGVLDQLPEGLTDVLPPREERTSAHARLDQRLQPLEPALHRWVLGIYANPLLRRYSAVPRELVNQELDDAEQG